MVIILLLEVVDYINYLVKLEKYYFPNYQTQPTVCVPVAGVDRGTPVERNKGEG
jgi:hypothetical protein